MVTGEEEHSTRGRANALRMVLSGALPPEELTGRRMFETYDLCLQCKGCKAECPSNVDVAKLKMEFLDGYYRRHGTPLRRADDGRCRAAESPRLGAWHRCRTGPQSCQARPGWHRSSWASIRAGRCPASSATIFVSGFARTADRPTAARQPGRAPRGPIVLLDDCLTSYCEPGVNRAAVDVLEAAGYEVHLAGLECCGRTWASKGLLAQARQLAEHERSAAAPLGRSGRADRWLRTELPVDARRRVSRAGARRRRAAGCGAGGAGGFAPGASRYRAAAGRRRRRRSCCTAIAIKRPWSARPKPWPPFRRFPARASGRSIPAAAAWPARSATNTTTSAWPSANGCCFRPSGRLTTARSQPRASRAATRSNTARADEPDTRSKSWPAA